MMKISKTISVVTAALLIGAVSTPAQADSAKPGQSMTHMKTAAGLSSTLESAGIVLYVQGGATSSVIGDSISSPNGQFVFHIPVTSTKTNVKHVGSNIVFFNTANNLQVQLQNPVIDLAKGVVTAVLPQAEGKSLTVLTITNAKTLKAKVTNDRKAKQATAVYTGASLMIAPGIGAALASLLGLPEGSLPDGITFGSADVTVYSKLK